MLLKITSALIPVACTLLALFGDTVIQNINHPWKRLTGIGRFTFLLLLAGLALQFIQFRVEGYEDRGKDSQAESRAIQPSKDVLAAREDIKQLSLTAKEALESSRRIERAVLTLGTNAPTEKHELQPTKQQ